MSSFYGNGGGSSSSSGTTVSTVISVSESTSSDYAKVYDILQDGVSVGTINIPKDMVVSSGVLETDPEGMDAGTYLVLTLANADADTIYINVADLIDVYTVAQSATQIQLALDGNELSATIVAGSVGTSELADSAITAAKIANGVITLTKLATSVQTSLGKADTAVQSVTTGTTNGTVNVDGTDIAVYGLDSAAYTKSTDYDAAGAAASVLGTSDDAAGTATVYGALASVSKNTDDINNLTTQVNTNTDNITSLTSTVNTNTNNINSLATQVDTNTNNISDLTSVVENKADKATTLEGYGITDAYTNTEVDSKIETALETASSDATTKADAALDSAKEYANSLADVANASTIYLNVSAIADDAYGNPQEELTITTVNSALTVDVDEAGESLEMYAGS